MKTGKVNFGLTYKPISSFKAGNSNFQMGGYYPLQTAQPAKKTDNENLFVKYSGVGALALVVASGAVMLLRKNPNAKALSELKQSVGSLTTTVSGLSQKIETIVANTAANSTIVKNIEQTTSNLSAKVGYFFGLLGAGVGGAAAVKALSNDKATDEEVSSIKKAAFNIFANRSASPASTPVVRPLVSDNDAIYGDLHLHGLNREKELSTETINNIQREIANALLGANKPVEIPLKDARMWSVSYETQFNNAGGQRDIAVEAPEAYTSAGIDTYAVAPLFDARLSNNSLERTLVKLDNGKYIYRTTCFNDPATRKPANIELEKLYEGKTNNGETFSVFEGVVGPKKQKYLFVTDNKYFNYGNYALAGGDHGTVYANLPDNHEKARMAQFNNIVYEALAAAKEGKLKRADGTTLEAPNAMIAHEAWQSGGLLAKMRLLSIAEEADKDSGRKPETAQYLRNLANNTGIPIHNLGTGYQGRLWNNDSSVISEYFNNIFGKYSGDMVNNIYIKGVKDLGGQEIFGTVNQRVGFTKNFFNPAVMSVVLASRIGTVSEGYITEIVDKNLAGGEIVPLLKMKQKNGELTAFPNGVDKAGLAATVANVEGTPGKVSPMQDINNKLVELLNIDKNNQQAVDSVKIRAYINSPADSKDKINPTAFADAKLHNKKMLVTLLKDAARNNPSPLIFKNGSANFVGNVNIDGINENTPIFSMASRMNAQKGFDTAVVAYGKLLDKLSTMDKKSDIPVLFMSGGDPGNEYDNKVNRLVLDVQKRHPEARILWTRGRASNAGLMLLNMTTTNTMPSDFEPYGISDLKGLYAGSHVIVTEVGGMLPAGSVSRKIYPAEIDRDGNLINSENNKKANAITVKDYDYMCLVDDDYANKYRAEHQSTMSKEQIMDQKLNANAEKLANAMLIDMNLSQAAKTELDLNAISTDVSWDKGAVQNYMKQLNIK